MTTKRMKHLSASTALVALNGKGSCFYRATAMVLDVPDSMLCIGTFAGATEQESVMNPKAAKQDFIHAWVEKGGEVFAPTLLTQTNHNFGPFPLDDYYKTNGAKDVVKLSRSEVLKLSGDLGLSAHIRHGRQLKGGAKFVPALLSKAGVAWKDLNGSAIPA